MEAHGTGTRLGDPIEVEALAAVYGGGRGSEQRLGIGSIKTNIGHLEAAAGIAGLMKVVLSLQAEHLPAHLHCETLSGEVKWSELPVEVVRQGRAWRRGERRAEQE